LKVPIKVAPISALITDWSTKENCSEPAATKGCSWFLMATIKGQR
jgi:hypothetical protein